MKRSDRKSHCPINFTLETVGDQWTLLILRDMAFFKKTTFKEFLASPERITTSVLASRLAVLEKNGVITKQPHTTDLRSFTYALTEKGRDFVPILHGMAGWGAQHDPKSKGLEFQGASK